MHTWQHASMAGRQAWGGSNPVSSTVAQAGQAGRQAGSWMTEI